MTGLELFLLSALLVVLGLFFVSLWWARRETEALWDLVCDLQDDVERAENLARWILESQEADPIVAAGYTNPPRLVWDDRDRSRDA